MRVAECTLEISAMPQTSKDDGRPPPGEVMAALDRVCASAAFRRAPKLTSFLRFVVEATLSGRGKRLKGYTIGVEALGRPESFNPQLDPIVRVEAIRLRTALAHYYEGAGAADPVAIELSRGRYAPDFSYRLPPSAAGGLAAGWRQAIARLQRFLRFRVTIQVHLGQIERDGLAAGKLAALKLAAIGPRLLPTAATAPHAISPDGRQVQQAEGASAARPRRPRPGRDRADAAHDRGNPRRL
jgi:hypothetical protein